MSNTPDNSNLQSRLLLVGEALKANDVSLALCILLDIRDTGFVNKYLDQHIQTLHENSLDTTSFSDNIPTIIDWVYATAELMRRTGADDFEQIEHVEPGLFDFSAQDFVSFDIDSAVNHQRPEAALDLASSIELDFNFNLEIGAAGSEELEFDFDMAFESPIEKNNDDDQNFNWFDDFDNSANLAPRGLNSGTDFNTSSLANKTAKRAHQQTPMNLTPVPNPFQNNAHTPTRLHNIEMELREPSNVFADAASTYSQPGGRAHQDADLKALLFEEELFAQAQSLAFDDDFVEPTESKPLYRGEPLRKLPKALSNPAQETTSHHTSDMQMGHEPTNSFAHDAPTGVGQSSLKDIEAHKPDDSAILIQQVRKLYDSGKFQSALDIINNVLAQTSTQEAEHLKQNIERELERQQHDRIGSLSRIPVLGITLNELSNHQLDHRAGFIISQMDGLLSFEDIIDMSAMSRLETMSVLADLCDRGLITFR